MERFLVICLMFALTVAGSEIGRALNVTLKGTAKLLPSLLKSPANKEIATRLAFLSSMGEGL
jgi:hypothetical protein